MPLTLNDRKLIERNIDSNKKMIASNDKIYRELKEVRELMERSNKLKSKKA